MTPDNEAYINAITHCTVCGERRTIPSTFCGLHKPALATLLAARARKNAA